MMHEEEEKKKTRLKTNAFWNRVYLTVVLFTIVVIGALWAFSRYFQ